MSFVFSKLENELINELIKYRHYFHENPELAFQENNTTQKIKDILQSWKIKILPTKLKTGVFAEIGPQTAKNTLALRADIDALPIQEESGVPFSSKNPGVMHACGHDTHIASLLGAAFLLKQQEADLPGKVRLLFQPAEEDQEGALHVIEDGKIDGVRAIIGFHNTPGHPIDAIGLHTGIVSGAIDKFKVTLKGVGTHASAPQNGKDVIVALGAELNLLQTIISRRIDPFKPAVLSVTHVNAGNTWNVLPQTAFFEGTVRTADKEARKQIKTNFLKLVKLTAEASDTQADIDWYDGDPSVDNDSWLTEIVKNESRKFASIYEQVPKLGSDDFACFQEHIPGVYANIGNGYNVSAHNPKFKADDRLIATGVKFFTHNTIRILNELNKRKRVNEG
ncbi:amidohydrolase [Liquorilactobacillus sicerae]|uniref:amidohydrolase n=1 Tax=Liquorilactobacillus sicerae TaxID=1416943 RepID=UPI002481119C|nr:amidohydrolase [Liquorilactobacillus sicerae]